MESRKAGSSSIPGKRPRDPTPPTRGEKELPGSAGATTYHTKKKSKPSNKKKDKNKTRHRSDSGVGEHHQHHHHHRSSHHGGSNTTTTPDGQRMTRLLSTFSQLEQSRFSAFQQSVLSTTAVEEWLAACVSRRLSGSAAVGGIGTNQSSPQPPLADLVAPNQDQDIVMVVATLAKIYAQRLVATAVQLRQEQSERVQVVVEAATKAENDGLETTLTTATAATLDHVPLEPRDILRSLNHRRQQGHDPGFFLQTSSTVVATNSGSTGSSNEHFDVRLAALAAEQEYDDFIKSTTQNKDNNAMQIDDVNISQSKT